MRIGALVIALSCGCSNVTNAPLYEDAVFLGALPSRELHGVPSVVAEATGEAPVLQHAAASARALETLLEPLLLSAESLRSTAPSERDRLLRGWDPIAVVGRSDNPWWVRGQVTRPSETSDLSWVIEMSASSGGPWTVAASGRHDPGGYGDVSWRLQDVGELLGAEPVGSLELDYDESDEALDGHRSVELVLLGRDNLEELRRWVVAGSFGLGWTGLFVLTDDAELLPGVAQVLQIPEGGRGAGILYRDEEPLFFDSCWTPEGESVYIAGDEITPRGDEARCAVPPF